MGEEFDEAKAEIEKLKADLKLKAELADNLRKAHGEQLIRTQEACSKIEKLARESNGKEEEISKVKRMCEDLQCSLNEKESVIRRLSTANDKLRVDCGEKYKKWEEEKRAIVLALDEANEKNIDQEQKINVFMAEIEGLKGLLSASQKKCLEAEKNAKASKEMRKRDAMLLKLEEESMKVENQLKWKKEQFSHLEEAHEKLRDQFRESKKEWEMEKSTLIDEICSLQSRLDSQTRILEDLERRFKMCNEALAREESRRNHLEVEVSEFKARFENVFTECQDAKSQLECLATQRDREIAALRHSLATKETFYKEIEYKAGRLEKENQELLVYLKELQEAGIRETGNSSSLAKMRNKLKSLEQMHKNCSSNLRAKEAEWSFQLEKLTEELDNYRTALESKETTVEELGMELEICHSVILQLKMQNEEASTMLLVLKSDFEDERQKVASLLKRIEDLDLVEDQRLLLQKELERYKELLEESSRSQLCFKKQALQTETDLKDKLKAVCDDLDVANSELAKEHQKLVSLSRKAKALDLIEEKCLLMQKELEKYKEALEQSSRHQRCLEKQALQIENDSKEKFREVCDAFDMASSEVAEHHEKVECFSRRVDHLELVEEQRLLMQKELERYKEMVKQSSSKQLLIEKKALDVETDLKKKLREVYDALDTANAELATENENTASLLRRVQSLDHIEEQNLQMQKELKKYKEMLEESSRCQHRLEKQALQKEKDLKEKLQEVCDALDRLKSDFAAKISEGHALEFELWMWKTIAHRLKDDLEESQLLRKDIEASLLSQVEVEETIKQEKDDLARLLKARDSRIDSMQHQIDFFEKELKTRESAAATSAKETVMSFESEKEGFLRTMREKDKILDDLQKGVGWLEQESLKRELEVSVLTLVEAERKFDLEKEHFIQLMEEKDQRIDDLLQCVRSREQKFNGSLISFSLELAEKQAEIGLVHEAWEKIASAEILAQLEIEEKKMMLMELEDDIFSVQKKLELQEKSLSESKHKAIEIEAELEEKLLEMKKLENLMETKLRMSEASVDELKKGNKSLAENVMKLSSERDNLIGFFTGLGERISQFSNEDMQLMGTLACMVQSFDNSGSSSPMLKCDTELFNAVKENVNTCPSPTTKRLQSVLEERAPFRELN
uniref:G protein gamma domain-containing protein n=1 Tax=Populus trichocarpa TaxID=3694 RepID=A0A3N7FRS4_POPTR